MKKKIFLAATAALLVTTAAAFVYANNKSADDDFWNRNAEALANNEGGVVGKCEDIVNECIAQCPYCNSLFYTPGHKGGAYGLSGVCPNCHSSIH